MREETFFVPGPMPGLNELIAWRASKYRGKYSGEKRKWQRVVLTAAKEAGVSQWMDGCHFHYSFSEPNRRRDPSNIASAATKFIEDALVLGCIIPDDGWKFVRSISYSWTIDQESPGVHVTLRSEQ